jgi:type IV pilus assembly protein PilF
MPLRFLPPVLVSAALLGAGCAHVPTPKEIERAEIHFDLGANAMNEGKAQEALKELLEAERLNPRLPEVQNALGLVYHWSYRRLPDARAKFRRAVELKADYAEAWNNLGVLEAELGELKAARHAFEQALADPLYKTPYIAQTNLAWVVHLQGQSEAARELVTAALAVQPAYCMGHRTMARIHDAAGRGAEAEHSWLQFARYCPDEPEALLQQASIQARRGEPAAASRTLLKCIEKAGAKAVGAECRQALAGLPPLPPEALVPARKPERRGVEGARDLEETQ